MRVNTEVSIHYDPMISKLAAWGRSRTEAIDRLRRALDEYQVGGIRTNLGFFREIVRDEEFIAGRLDTGFIARFKERREAASQTLSTQDEETRNTRQDVALIAGAIHYAKLQKKSSLNRQPAGETTNPWKISGRSSCQFVRDPLSTSDLTVRRGQALIKLKAEVAGNDHQLSIQQRDSTVLAEVDGRRYRAGTS